MKGGKKPLGYTIIEVMIVLTVSGVMFLIAANFINGKQQRAAFTSGVNDMASRIQDVIEQVKDGQYSDINLNCSFDNRSGPRSGWVTVNSGGSNPQGTNPNCVFLGKVIYFSPDANAPNGIKYEVLSLAGGRVDLRSADNPPITTPKDAGAHVIPNLTTTATIPQSLNVQKVTVRPFFFFTSYAIAFVQNPSVDSGGSLSNGGGTVNMYYVWGLGPNNGSPENTINGGANFIAAQGADICLTDGNRYADIVLGVNTHTGNNGNPLSVDVTMDGTTPC